LLSPHCLSDAFCYFFDAFIDISPAYGELSTIDWESEKILLQYQYNSTFKKLAEKLFGHEFERIKEVANVTYLTGIYCLISFRLFSGTK